MLYLSSGLPLWAGLVGWAAYTGMQGAPAPLKQTIAATTAGIVVGWCAEVLAHLIPVPPDTWLWIPRAALAVAVTLPLLLLTVRWRLSDNIFPALSGYGAVFAALASPPVNQTNLQRLTGLHLSNPIVLMTISMALGVLSGWLEGRLEAALRREHQPTD